VIKAIFFDLGGVLFTNGTKQFIEYLSTTYKLDKEHAASIIDKGELPDAYREGKIGRAEYWGKVKEELHLSDHIDTLEKKWIDGYELIQETRDIIHILSKKYKVYFLSNNVKDRVAAVDKKFNFLAWFEDGVFSHEVGVRKPHPQIYVQALKKADATPSEALFIDDKESALHPAKEMGMTTILFENPGKLKTELTALHII
jgi:epoxide hydrolase-like predicted phosphatase